MSSHTASASLIQQSVTSGAGVAFDGRVALITNMISPYRVPLFNEVNRRLYGNLKVIVLDEREQNRQWRVSKEACEFSYELLPGVHGFIRSRELPLHLNRGVWKAIKSFGPDVVVTSGYDTLAYWQALAYAKLHRRGLVLWNGTTLLSTSALRGPIGFAKKEFIRAASSYLSYGTLAAQYLLELGAAQDRVTVGLNTVDMEWYRGRAEELRRSDAAREARARYPGLLLLYVGQLIPRKGVLTVLQALASLKDQDTGLLVLGSGPQQAELLDFCRQHGLRSVYFEGFKQQEEMPPYYALADVLVLPSLKEVWGLVVNEALASGLHVLCSITAGAGPDLIRPGWNGALFDPSHPDELAALISHAKRELPEIRARREAISRQACEDFGIERAASAMVQAVCQAARR